MDIYDYIKNFAEHNLLSVKSFERKCGLANGTVKSLTRNSRKSTWDKITATFPYFDLKEMFRLCCDVDMDYIESPETHSSGASEYVQVSRSEYEDMKARIESQQKTIDYLLGQLSKVG